MSQIANPAIQGTWSMSEIRSGNLLIRTRADKVAFEFIGNTTKRSIIDSSELPALLEFLNSYLQSRSNRRTGFRINLSQLKQDISSRFRVFVEADGRKVAVTPIDLSLSGICVKSRKIIGEQGAQVDISLSYDDLAVVLPATVVRQNDSRTHTAFHFIGVVKEDGIDPPSQLDSIFRAIEALWLDNSLNLRGPN